MSTRRQALQLYSGFLHKGKFKTFSSIMKQSYFKLSFDRTVKIYLWGRRNCYWLRLAPRAYFIRTKIPVCIYKISIDDGTTFSGISGKGETPNLWKLLFENNRSVWFSEFLEFFLACLTFWNFNHVNNLDFPGNYFTICRRVWGR